MMSFGDMKIPCVKFSETFQLAKASFLWELSLVNAGMKMDDKGKSKFELV